MRGVLMLVSTTLVATWSGAAASAQQEPGWRWIPDTPDTTTPIAQMPPGWHITTGSGTVIYHPALEASGRYALESEVFLFPRGSGEGYGLFIGARHLGQPGAEYLAFLIRRDGQYAVEHRRNGTATAAVPWTPAAAIRRVSGDSTVRQVIRVVVERDSLLFDVNASRVASLARGSLPAEGHFGFRTGAGLSIHVSTLDLTRRLAPPRP